MPFIAVDGPTGVGKSTTARALAEELDARLVLDPVSVSPLLDDYYTGDATPAAAIDTELAFLRSRAELLATAPADGVTVNTVQPGTHDTPRIDALVTPEQKAQMRLGDADDFGSIVTFLCSEQASFVTGLQMHVDGGSFGGLGPSRFLGRLVGSCAALVSRPLSLGG